MTFLTALYTLIISPLELLLEVIFMVADKVIGNVGLSIIFLSIAVNFLVLPLYKRADELQAEERGIQAKMADRIKRTKQTFKGDERFMMLQEYYRINKYKPIYALKSSASLLLQIPFFIAAYRLLSGMQSLQGMSFGFISDLGQEDAAFMIGSFPVNILPIVMTLINIVTGIIYTKGQPLKSKIQVYGLAVVFLVLLYHSPAGLVFYWLLNNVFALVKNIFYKLKEPKKILNIVLAAAGAVILVLVLIKPDLSIRQKFLLGIGCLLLAMPLVLTKIRIKQKAGTKDAASFFLGAVLMALITGLLIPSAVINDSVMEFIDVIHPSNPLIYVANSMLLSVGCWVLWGGVFYCFMSDNAKSLFGKAIWMICGISVVDYMLFGTNLGTMSSMLQYDKVPSFKITEYIINTLAVIAVAAVFYFVYTKFRKITKTVLIAGILAVAGIGIINSTRIAGNYVLYEVVYLEDDSGSASEMPVIPLSKTGNNVIVLMMDRAMGTYPPYIFNEKPELLEQFDGFTYYPNTISYGPTTLIGSPALYGGYDYTPERINERAGESLESKHNEALKVMPEIFGRNGYTVTICDQSYAGYKWVPDYSIYSDHPEYNCYNTIGRFDYFEDISGTSFDMSARVSQMRNRNFFCFSLMKVAPLFLQETLYDNGRYNESLTVTSDTMSVEASAIINNWHDVSTGYGYSYDFLDSYSVLTNLPEITAISDDPENTFLIMANKTAHSPFLLQEPDYVPATRVDNTAYDADMVSRYTVDGKTLGMTEADQVALYHVNMAAYKALGEWFDYLREQGVWDNTRIIIVSDHGFNAGQFDLTATNGVDMEYFLPLLMVKDFGATGFTVCEDFMTNGDTPTLATAGLIEDPFNPFTDNPINSDPKNGPQTVLFSNDIEIDNNNGFTIAPCSWYVLDGDPHDPSSWKHIGDF